MSEAALWKYLLKILPLQGHYSRIESHDTCPGYPDVHYTIDGVSGTLELKSTKRPKAQYPFSSRDGLRRSQLAWIRDQAAVDGKVLLVLQAGKHIYFIDAGLYADDIHEMTAEDLRRVSKWHVQKGVELAAEETARLYTALIDGG